MSHLDWLWIKVRRSVLWAALICATYSIVLDKIAKRKDAFLISIIQLGAVSALGAVAMCLFESPALLSFLFRHEVWSIRSYLGAALILLSVVFSALMTSGRNVTAPKKRPADVYTVCR